MIASAVTATSVRQRTPTRPSSKRGERTGPAGNVPRSGTRSADAQKISLNNSAPGLYPRGFVLFTQIRKAEGRTRPPPAARGPSEGGGEIDRVRAPVKPEAEMQPRRQGTDPPQENGRPDP